MEQLEPDRFVVAEALFSTFSPDHLSVVAVLGGSVEGRVLVDDPATPRLGLRFGPEGAYLAGAVQSGTDVSAVREALDDWAYLHVARDWQGELAGILPHRFMIEHPRLAFSIATAPFVETATPEGFEVRVEDGFGHRLLHGNEEISRCLPDVVAGERTEIGVWTHPAFRRRGLASAAARLTLAAARRQGISTAGWHCHASNRGSIALAKKLGGGMGRATSAYSASLPAENVGDLDAAAPRTLGEHFERAAETIGWMNFHAAAAWAQAGQTELALRAVERLVAGGWQGNPNWLTGHWALAGLRSDPRFARSVARLRAAAD
jgi:ribosomal protein S18 acetylase RimI-like enzyme